MSVSACTAHCWPLATGHWFRKRHRAVALQLFSPPHTPLSLCVVLLHASAALFEPGIDVVKQHAALCKLQYDVEVVGRHKHVPQLDHVGVVHAEVVLESAHVKHIFDRTHTDRYTRRYTGRLCQACMNTDMMLLRR